MQPPLPWGRGALLPASQAGPNGQKFGTGTENAFRFGAGMELPSKGRCQQQATGVHAAGISRHAPVLGTGCCLLCEPGTGAILTPPPSQQFNSLTLGKQRRLELWWRQASRTSSTEDAEDICAGGQRRQGQAAVIKRWQPCARPTGSEFFPWFSCCPPMASGERGARGVTREGCRGHRGSGARGAAARMELRTAACRSRERRGRLPYEEDFRTRTCTGAAFVTLSRGGTCYRAQGHQTKT